MKRMAAAISLALMMVPFVGSDASAQDPSTIADSRIVEQVECFFRSYINEGGESGLECFS